MQELEQVLDYPQAQQHVQPAQLQGRVIMTAEAQPDFPLMLIRLWHVSSAIHIINMALQACQIHILDTYMLRKMRACTWDIVAVTAWHVQQQSEGISPSG